MLYDPQSKRARSLFEASVSVEGSAPRIERFGSWTVYRQQAKQGATPYTILDAKREGIGDVHVKVRLAWPHLTANSDTYDSKMESLFQAFLSSVRGAIGKYEPPPGVKVRRPEP
jgi:hypothetical protein